MSDLIYRHTIATILLELFNNIISISSNSSSIYGERTNMNYMNTHTHTS